MKTRVYEFEKGYEISIVLNGKLKRIFTDITRRNDKKKLDKLNEYLQSTYNRSIIELHDCNSGLNRDVTLTIDRIVEVSHSSGCSGLDFNRVIVFINGEIIEIEQVKQVDQVEFEQVEQNPNIGKLTSIELEHVISSRNVQLIYRWLLNEYCYCRSENVKLLFELIKYYIVELIKNDKSITDSFKIGLIETLNKIR